ncbi:SDR family NAD(P)-dependent oxidoreductase [Nocardia fusca]|uniref:SDR family NAD(P)-dependent oxidoreductase n=1 Tax=Nocardia fusca TaxID=941183 RepID=UPI0007A75E67|nr:SDR family NAD(P)-dependent oxidoreductase [Nocardia fusca]
MSHQPLDGSAALVTGAGCAIGRATAHHLVRAGAAVALVSDRGDRLERIVDDITMSGGKAIAVAADITDPALAYQAVEDTRERLGRLDVLVNGAGLMGLDTALHTPVEEWDRMVSLNVSALLHVTHAAVPYLIDAAATSPRQIADLVNVGSLAGRVARPAGSVDNLTAAGLNGFTESLRQELRPESVRVSVVAPGAVHETIHGAAHRPAGSMAERLQPEHVADAIAYIVTREQGVAVNELLIRAVGQTW